MLERYEFLELLGSGSFGDVFKAKDLHTHSLVAIKVVDSEVGLTALEREADFLTRLKGVKGVPCLLNHFTVESKGYLVMEILGQPILEDMEIKSFSITHAAKIIHKVLKILKRIHAKRIIHRDIKPENILYGTQKHRKRVYLVDFGLAKLLTNRMETNHGRRPSRFIGTKLFSSSNAFAGNEQSYRDDLEGLCYVLIWLIRHDLPWCHYTGREFNVMEGKKVTAKEQEITQGCPSEVEEYLMYVRSLRYADTPDYAYLVRLISQLKCRKKSVLLQDHLGLSVREQKRLRRKSNPPATITPVSPESTPILKPPTISTDLRQRIRQMNSPFLLQTCTPRPLEEI